MKRIIILAVALFLLQFTNAQDYKFGKVSKEEIEQTRHHIDTTANAAVLYRKHRVLFNYRHDKGFGKRVEIQERIKIYNKEGYDYATKIIRLYKGTNRMTENVPVLKANTYILDDGKVKKIKLKKDGVFDEEINEYWKSKKITMPNIEDGCVIEFLYTIDSPLLEIDDIIFQKSIPIDRLDVSVETPEWYKYKRLINPKASYVPKLEYSTKNKKVKISYRNDKTKRDNNLMENTTSNVVSYDTNIFFDFITAKEINIPALKEETMVRHLSNYQSKLILELTSVQYPNQPIKNYSTSWDKVARTIYESEGFGGQLAKNKFFKEDIDVIISKTNNEIDRIGKIYNFVKSKVKWNGFNGYSTQNGVRKAYKERVGNSGDINLMLTSMLRYAGISANPVLVSTSSNGIPIFPTTNGFNFVISAVELDGAVILLDATDEYATANILSDKLLNWQGRIIRESGSSTWVSLMPKENSKEITSINAKISDDLSIEGKARVLLSNQAAKNFRDSFNNLSEEEHIKSLEKGNGDIEVSDLNVKESHNLSKPIMYSYGFYQEEGVEEIGGKLYFSPLLFLGTEENPFKQENRVYPIDFIYPRTYKYSVNIQIPEGYEVETMPKSTKVNYNDTEGDLTCLSRANGSMIQLTFTFNINNSLILPENYSVFKQFFQAMIDAQQEKIVLKKM